MSRIGQKVVKTMKIPQPLCPCGRMVRPKSASEWWGIEQHHKHAGVDYRLLRIIEHSLVASRPPSTVVAWTEAAATEANDVPNRGVRILALLDWEWDFRSGMRSGVS